MAFDGIVIANLVYELKEHLAGCRISKISMPNKDELLFTIKGGGTSRLLLASASPSLPLLYLTEEKKPSPMVAPAFCMLLRKHIGTGRVTDLYQMGLERIVCMELEHMNELGDLSKKKLYFELMGKHSNIIFTNEEDIIIDSIKRISASVSSLREVLPGRVYFLPQELKKQNFLHTSEEMFFQLADADKYPLAKLLYMHFEGISPLIATEICERASLSTELAFSKLSLIEKRHLYHTFRNLLEEVQQHIFVPNILYKDDVPVDFSSISLHSYQQGENVQVQTFDSISKLLQEFYSAKDMAVRIRQKSADLRKVVANALERVSKKYDLQLKQIGDSEKKDKFKVYGDLINTYGYALLGGEELLVCENYYDDNKTIRIPLDKNLSATENAKRYYEKYAKQKRTFEALSEEIKNTEFDLELLQSISMSLDLASDEDDLALIKNELIDYGYLKRKTGTKDNRHKLVQKPLHFRSTDGFDIYVGKNNLQNDYITFKLAKGNDWWFHAKGMPGSHVIVKSEGRELTDRTFEEAAALAAYFSKGSDAPKVEVDYLQRANLKKIPSGAPGFVVYHTNWSLMAKPELVLATV